MGAEKLTHHVGELALESMWLGNEELRHILAVHVPKAWIVADFPQSRGKSQGKNYVFMEKNKKQKTLELDAESGNMKGERQGEVTNKSELSAS